ncbi:acetyl-CoA C-acyltransferase [Gammaproteobacteria bacterium]|nr:acetyl-CoA C-acyltransferase [Gammaproteobacteria bacterium]
MKINDPIVITGIARTPQGNMLGALKDFSAPQLGAIAIKGAIENSKISPNDITDLIMGCVLSAGLGQAPGRQASLYSNIPESTHCLTINKMCGSGMQAVILAYQALLSTDSNNIYVAGGMESMTNAPFLAMDARKGYRLGHKPLLDHLIYDGLEDAYDKGKPMGYFAESCAKDNSISRDEQDLFALESIINARNAIKNNSFKNEITSITIKNKKIETKINLDEHPQSVNPDKFKILPPIFKENGTITAGNACSIADGAAALVLMRESKALKMNLKPIAKILNFSTFSKPPTEFATAPVGAIKLLLNKLKWDTNKIDLYEINEAFAVVPLFAMKELNIPRHKINIYGGGCALGHPIGATGARILVTLVSALINENKKYGVASLCIGGGEATAIAIENLI